MGGLYIETVFLGLLPGGVFIRDRGQDEGCLGHTCSCTVQIRCLIAKWEEGVDSGHGEGVLFGVLTWRRNRSPVDGRTCGYDLALLLLNSSNKINQ